MFSAASAQTCKIVALDANDAVTAAPANHRVVFENDDVRVLDVTVAPHSKEPMHTHIWPSVMYIDHTTVNQYTRQGMTPYPVRTPSPTFHPTPRWVPSEPWMHSTESFSDTAWHAIRIEIKHPGCGTTPSTAMLSPLAPQ
jgi:hypothetical protein